MKNAEIEFPEWNRPLFRLGLYWFMIAEPVDLQYWKGGSFRYPYIQKYRKYSNAHFSEYVFLQKILPLMDTFWKVFEKPLPQIKKKRST